MKYLLALLLFSTIVYADENIPKERYSEKYNKGNTRFWVSDYVDNHTFYIIYDRVSRCKFLVANPRNISVPLPKSDGTQDCSDSDVTLYKD